MNTKNKVLALLEQYRGYSICGSRIADTLGVSRSAVWKAIKELEKDGHKIEAATNRGYRFCDDSDVLSVVGIEQFLTNAKASVKVYDSLESTNTTAKELAISGAAHGTVVVAESQTDGKGRYGRGFESPKGSGIYMSIVLRPQDFGGKPVLVTSYAAVTVCEAIESLTDKSPTIKWVNDVFIDGKKICGILTEAVSDFESGGVQWVVVGIGINFTANENLPEVAGAVFEDSPCITRNRLIAEVVNRMLSFNGTCDISEYRKRLMWVGERVTATGHGEVVIVGVDDEARLIVRKDDLQEVALCSGEVSVVSLQSH